jgi:hypothetical protein
MRGGYHGVGMNIDLLVIPGSVTSHHNAESCYKQVSYAYFKKRHHDG